jgi:hypothetical protein
MEAFMPPRQKSSQLVPIKPADLVPLFSRALEGVRDDMRGNPYLLEAIKVLPVGGYRSAIGSVWNAIVDDLRSKIIHRSIELFNKAVTLQRKVESYEDLQNFVNDDQLIDGAYKIGVISWEASKILKHAKETRHVFDGHPKSSEPSIIKVLAMLDDCVKYVLSEPYPAKIIDIDEYIGQMGSADYDRNEIAIENALSELPDIYKNELANRIYTAYISINSSSIIRSNIEFAAPILWNVLAKDIKIQIARRVDHEISAGNAVKTNLAFVFVDKVDGQKYLSPTAKRYRVAPLIEGLVTNLDNWSEEDKYVKELEAYSAVIPDELLKSYVQALTLTYIGYTGSSYRFSRTDFYADAAALIIPKMFQSFDDRAADHFINVVKGKDLLKRRIGNPAKLNRLRMLGNIVLERVSEKFSNRNILDNMVNPSKEMEFFKGIDKRIKQIID